MDDMECLGSHSLMQLVVLIPGEEVCFPALERKLEMQPVTSRPLVVLLQHGLRKILNPTRQECVNLLKLRIFSPLTQLIGSENLQQWKGNF